MNQGRADSRVSAGWCWKSCSTKDEHLTAAEVFEQAVKKPCPALASRPFTTRFAT